MTIAQQIADNTVFFRGQWLADGRYQIKLKDSTFRVWDEEGLHNTTLRMKNQGACQWRGDDCIFEDGSILTMNGSLRAKRGK